MADGNAFPQIPTTVWWGVRALLNKTPRAIVSDDLLGVELSVQAAAARQYVAELKRVGILNEENRATDLAHKWRMPDTYTEAVSQILENCYGEGLRTVAPTTEDRAKAIDWFQRQGLGEGAARNKAATYFLIASTEPGEAATKSQNAQPKTKVPKKSVNSPVATHDVASPSVSGGKPANDSGMFPVNLNLQIHISADASIDQIDAIFSSMRKHLGTPRIS